MPELTQNQYGAYLGGPIKKDKLFFFVSWKTIYSASKLLPLSMFRQRRCGPGTFRNPVFQLSMTL